MADDTTGKNLTAYLKYTRSVELRDIEDNLKPIVASAKFDPGCRDLFGNTAQNIMEKAKDDMDNLKVIPNDGIIKSDNPIYPATDHLIQISCNYKIGDVKRNYVLIVEDMQYEYDSYIKYVIPNVKAILDQFRALKLPVVWTNWARRHEDGFYGALDRFYGSEGIGAKINPCYVYNKNAHHTVADLAPMNAEEESRSIVSLHLSKFADYDDEGREILFPMLEAWGVNTIVLCGAWTDDCIAATAFDAADKYGYDVILVNNGCATATSNGSDMIKVLCGSTCCSMSSDEIVAHLKNYPELIEDPKAPLNGNVRFRHTDYRHDAVLAEVISLRKEIALLKKGFK